MPLSLFLKQTPIDKSTWQSPRHLLASTKVGFSLLTSLTFNAGSHETVNTYSIVQGKSCFSHFHPDCVHNLRTAVAVLRIPAVQVSYSAQGIYL